MFKADTTEAAIANAASSTIMTEPIVIANDTVGLSNEMASCSSSIGETSKAEQLEPVPSARVHQDGDREICNR